MKFLKLGVISFIILNFITLGCLRSPGTFPDSSIQPMSKFDQELLERATLHQSKGQIGPATVLWNKFLKRNPSSFAARNNLGLLYYANDEVTQAIYHFDQGLKLRPGAVQLKINLVRALKVQAAIFEENMEYHEAIIDLRRVVQLSPAKERESIERQIEALEDRIFKQVKKSNSIEEYQEFLKKYPNSPVNSDEARLWIENRLQAEKMSNLDSFSNDLNLSLETRYMDK